MVGPFYFALKSRLAGIAGRNKLLIKEKLNRKVGLFALSQSGSRVQGLGFKVEVAALPPFLLGDARKWYLSH